jgi:hypothetical protein
MAADTIVDTKHPAPERDKVGFASLCFSLAAPPLAWSLQSIAGYCISSEACYPGDTPLLVPLFSSLRPLLLTINGAALLIGILGFSIAYRNWCATRRETGGGPAQLIERGEGRTRFLAMCGIFVGAGFVVATLFTSLSLLLSPLCR